MLTMAMLALSLSAAADPQPKWDMTTFTLVLVRPGTPGPEEGLETGHAAWLQDLAAQGKLLAAGPIEGASDLLEVLVLDVPKVEEARPLLDRDPWVRSGRRRAEVHPWFAARGILRVPDLAAPVTRITFGLLRRPGDAPQLPPEKLEEIQAGHMKNIEAMADSGALVIAGPLADDGTIRGVFVFRGTDQRRLRALAAPDPAIQANRLALDLYRWVVPEGLLPEPARP